MLIARAVRNDPNYDTNHACLELNSDFGREFSNVQVNSFTEFLRSHKIAHNVPMADCQWQNGVVEGNVAELKEAAILSLRLAGLDAKYFPWAIQHAVHMSNLLPTEAHGNKQSPYERLFGEAPKLGKVIPQFAQKCIYKVGSKKSETGSKGAKGYITGMNLYSPGPPGYLIYNPTTKRVMVRQNVKLVPPSSERPAMQMNSLNIIINDDEERQEELNFQEADMKELMGITANKTFGAVVTEEQALANGADIIDTKMVRTKKLDGTLKSRLCGRGFTQKEGQSFWQTFCPTPMLPSILTTVAIAAQFDYGIFGLIRHKHSCSQTFPLT